MKVDISTLKEDISKLKSQIVESPDELKSQMEKMRENVKTIKSSIVCENRCSFSPVKAGYRRRHPAVWFVSLLISERN